MSCRLETSLPALEAQDARCGCTAVSDLCYTAQMTLDSPCSAHDRIASIPGVYSSWKGLSVYAQRLLHHRWESHWISSMQQGCFLEGCYAVTALSKRWTYAWKELGLWGGQQRQKGQCQKGKPGQPRHGCKPSACAMPAPFARMLYTRICLLSPTESLVLTT